MPLVSGLEIGILNGLSTGFPSSQQPSFPAASLKATAGNDVQLYRLTGDLIGLSGLSIATLTCWLYADTATISITDKDGGSTLFDDRGSLGVSTGSPGPVDLLGYNAGGASGVGAVTSVSTALYSPLSSAEWHLVTAVCVGNPASTTIQLDNEDAVEDSSSPGATLDSYDSGFGIRLTGDVFLYDLRFYNRLMTTQERIDMFTSKLSSPASVNGLVGSWFTTATLNDNSTSGNNLQTDESVHEFVEVFPY